MEKKNPYVMTIGFKKEDPDHIMVAELLNSMGRGKAQYIVKAVLVYQNLQQSGELPTGGGIGLVYEAVRRIVLQVLEEQDGQGRRLLNAPTGDPKFISEDDMAEIFDEEAVSGIMESLAAFGV